MEQDKIDAIRDRIQKLKERYIYNTPIKDLKKKSTKVNVVIRREKVDKVDKDEFKKWRDEVKNNITS